MSYKVVHQTWDGSSFHTKTLVSRIKTKKDAYNTAKALTMQMVDQLDGFSSVILVKEDV